MKKWTGKDSEPGRWKSHRHDIMAGRIPDPAAIGNQNTHDRLHTQCKGTAAGSGLSFGWGGQNGQEATHSQPQRFPCVYLESYAIFTLKFNVGHFRAHTANSTHGTRGRKKRGKGRKMLFKNRILMAPDTGNSGGGADQQGTANAAGAGQEGQQKSGEGETPETESKDSGKAFSQADVDRIVQDRLERERAKAEKEREKAEKAADEKRLAEQQKWQELAAKRQGDIEALEAQIDDLKTEAAKVQKYAKALEGYRDALIESVPDPVKELLKGMDIADQLSWLSANANTLNGRAPGFPQMPKPAGDQPEISPQEKSKRAFVPRM